MISSPLFRLLTLPTAAWNMVKGNESFKFMAFVKSNNYMNAKIENSGAISVLDMPGPLSLAYLGVIQGIYNYFDRKKIDSETVPGAFLSEGKDYLYACSY